MTAKTSEFLATELDKAGLPDLAIRARRDEFHDFLSPHTFPELTLVEALRIAGTPEAIAIRTRVIDGEFDASTEESDDWARSPEGQEMLSMLTGKGLK